MNTKIDMFDELLSTGKFNSDDSVSTLRYIGPFYQQVMANAGIFTIRDLVVYLNSAPTAGKLSAAMAALAHNQRAGEMVRNQRVPQCNSRVCLMMSELMAFAARHPELFFSKAGSSTMAVPTPALDHLVVRFKQHTSFGRKNAKADLPPIPAMPEMPKIPTINKIPKKSTSTEFP